MIIQRMEIKDFLVFNGEFAMDSCSGVNVCIGGNGTGKTTLLKILYWGCEFSQKSKMEVNGNLQLSRSTDFPYRSIFLLEDYFSGAQSTEKEDEKFKGTIKIYAQGHPHPVLDVSVSNALSKLQMHNIGKPESGALVWWSLRKVQSIFIPATEMLQHAKGFLALERERRIPFDKTQIDILAKAELGETREITPNAKKMLDPIKKIIRGEVFFENDTFYVLKIDGPKIPFPLEASGFCKFGLLWKLLRNGLLEDGSILFWDEPENSLNPEMIPLLVDILLELSRNGVQIFIATHDYSIARYFDVRKDKNIPVMFHNLLKSEDGRIICKSSAEYVKLPENLLETAGEALFDAVVAEAMGMRKDV